eukprot:3102080-Amphidinium_carterae.1
MRPIELDPLLDEDPDDVSLEQEEETLRVQAIVPQLCFADVKADVAPRWECCTATCRGLRVSSTAIMHAV